MPIIRAQCSIPTVTTVTEDTVTNTFHFTTTGWDETIQGSIATALMDFYEDLDAYKSDNGLWTAARVKFYNLSEPEPRVPLDDISLGLTSAGTTTPLPPEVSICLSFHGEYVSGFSQARRRGRVYLGPLHTGVLDTATGQLASTVPTTVAGAGAALLTTSNAAADWAWVVYSPTSGQAYPVVGGWCDNAPDIQRGRGLKATSRSSF